MQKLDWAQIASSIEPAFKQLSWILKGVAL